MTTHDEWQAAEARDLDAEFWEANRSMEEEYFRPTRPAACIAVPDVDAAAAYERWLLDLPREACGAGNEADGVESPF